jgi:uncharacterized protein YjbJ (UPF0337 family)
MADDVLKGRWRQLKGEVKTRWAKLTDDDLMSVEGSFDKLVGRIQERYGYAKNDAQREVDEFLMRHPATP